LNFVDQMFEKGFHEMTGSGITNGEVKRLIRDELGIVHAADALNEAFVVQPKQFDIKSEKLSRSTKDAHIALYKGYVDKFNETSARLDAVDKADSSAVSSEFRALKTSETYALNSIYLHELYFANVGDVNSMIYSDMLAHMRLDRDFGGFKRWQDDFIACAMAAREGWVITCLNVYLRRYVNVIVDGDDQGIPVGCFPVIALDVWAHSYVRDFTGDSVGNDRRSYVRAMMQEFNWRVIEDRFTRAERVVDALK
jgi:Fe-Mn family superoxide dismutase